MRSKILTIAVALCFAGGVLQPLSAQVSTKAPRSASRRQAVAGLAPTAAEQVPSGQYPTQALEELRAELLNLSDSVQEFADLAPPDLVDSDSLQEARVQIQQMPPQYLNALRQGISPSKLHNRLQLARTAVADYRKTAAATKVTGGAQRDTAGFPNASGTCSSANGTDVKRIPTGVVIAADVVFFIADGVREFAQDACKQEAVILGEGGNTSLACIIVDTVWIVAKAVDEGIHFCDDDLTGAVIDTNYARLDHIHNDLAAVQGTANTIDSHLTTVDGHLTTVNNQITTEFTALDTHVTNVDNHVANEFTTLSGLVTALVGNLSAQVTASTNKLVDGQKQIMKLELTPDGQRQIVPAILSCNGAPSGPTTCPDVLLVCSAGKCSWNNAGPLP